MKKYNNLKLLTKPKNLNEESFIMRLQNGYVLIAEYHYQENNKLFFLDYHLYRHRNEDKAEYILHIAEGEEKADVYHDFCTKRDKTYNFQSPQEALKFLKEKEYFKISDWGYRRRKKF